jgi:PAS domain S-box-containing protein
MVEGRMRQAMEERVPFQVEYRLVWPDNTLHWVNVTSKYYFDDSGRCTRLLGAVMDITNQKQAEEALRESEERYRLLAETMLQGVVHQDANGTIISMNPAAERILGWSHEQFLGSSSVKEENNTIRENGENFPGIEHPSMVALRTGLLVRGVIMGVFNPKLGDYRWIKIDAVPLFRLDESLPSEVYAVFEDVTELKQAEKELQESVQRLNFHVDNSPLATVEWDSDFIVTRWGGEAEKIFGWNRAETIGKPIMDLSLIYEEDIPIVQKTMEQLTDGSSKYVISINRNYTKDRKIIICEWYNSVLIDTHSKMVSVFSQVLDITERKEAEEELRKARDMLELRVMERTVELAATVESLRSEIAEREHAEIALHEETIEKLRAVEELREKEIILLQQSRLAAIGQLAGGMAHEVRNPLNAILSISEALFKEKGVGDNPEYEPYIQHIRTQVKRLAHLMNDLLELGKPIPATSLHPVPLREVCKDAVKLLELSGVAKEHRIIPAWGAISDDFKVLADGVKLQQILSNLLENAIQHSPKGSEVELKLLIPESRNSAEEMAVIRICDSGSGIPIDRISRIFEPFYSTRKGGTGLGLALVRHFVEHMCGQVMIRNNDPQPGCTAEVRLHVAREEQK